MIKSNQIVLFTSLVATLTLTGCNGSKKDDNKPKFAFENAVTTVNTGDTVTVMSTLGKDVTYSFQGGTPENVELNEKTGKITFNDLGNTILVVEHDEDMIRSADYLVDIGPGAGVHGGEVIAQGKVEDLIKVEKSITGQYLSGKKYIPVPFERRKGNGKFLEINGCKTNNLKNINVKFPLGKFICVTGISGSGKSSLIDDTLYSAIQKELFNKDVQKGIYREIKGLESYGKGFYKDK